MGGPPPYRNRAMPPRNSGPWRTVLYTPGVTNTPRTVEHAVGNLWGTVDDLGARAAWYGDPDAAVLRQPPDLLIVDEADRLKTASLEQLRDFYDSPSRGRRAHWDAGFAETTRTLRSAVLAGWLRSPVPTR
jgi:hypothetical protein